MIRRLAAVTLSVCLLASGCADPQSSDLVVSAASSLTEAFGEIAKQFTASTGLRVRLNIAGTPELVAQVREHAAVDVIATADNESVESLEADKLVKNVTLFARNVIEIAVAPGNPRGVRDLADVANSRLRSGLCDEAVPCGKYSREILGDAGVNVQAATLEENVKGLVSKIELKELDVGLVYRSDIVSSKGALEGIEIPNADDYPALYPAAVVTYSRNSRAAEFVKFLSSKTARGILSRRGFDIP